MPQRGEQSGDVVGDGGLGFELLDSPLSHQVRSPGPARPGELDAAGGGSPCRGGWFFGLVVAVAGRVQRVDWLGVDGGGAAEVGASGTHGDLVDRGGQAGAGFRAAPSVASWYLHSVWRQVRPSWRTSPIR